MGCRSGWCVVPTPIHEAFSYILGAWVMFQRDIQTWAVIKAENPYPHGFTGRFHLSPSKSPDLLRLWIVPLDTSPVEFNMAVTH